MAYETCKICGVFCNIGAGHFAHKCLPQWEWYCADIHGSIDDSWSSKILFANGADYAAEQAAALYDAGEYYLLNGGEVEIYIRDVETREVSKWVCFGETVPRYSAKEVTI
jgi:hypothetical protein